MRATEIIRNLLDIIDAVDKPPITAQVSLLTPAENTPMNQIQDLLNKEQTEFENSPNEQYADVNSVTTNAGGGLNGPKHIDDIRGTTTRIYGDN